MNIGLNKAKTINKENILNTKPPSFQISLNKYVTITGVNIVLILYDLARLSAQHILNSVLVIYFSRTAKVFST